ncbi:MAG: class II fructose-bisphosphate aldolase [Candidatus Thermoplasmatota archaeon]|nr:class II fructose-bisphosphate aldolase [Euryarchaeota archaeon]MBU4031617.1 class II fructose-bisphosphate aldolase [Candidatus Thermoplasmatota archaeon]MBU4072402.1 class II fructose-bisphosphate aldolase [Candidatus Thermoplasmatota archaeon]MBU4144937.1 class II fructose-bisphosphate aldolase [Candidatus Thermoplasmatota archaeon]MBU4591692.1 class II fructose-bisphosphate aldolase [Candidatus Thermoplasmatota archaeon]
MYEPIPGDIMFRSLKDQGAIIMAANARMTRGVARGIFRAAQDLDAPVMFEIARSECDQNGGYTGMKPADYARQIQIAADEVKFDIWALHADHITVKKGTPEDITNTKELIDLQVQAGFTSFAIDASHLFNFKGGNLREELALNIEVTTELAKHIKNKMGDKSFGLEVEVGEIGKEGDKGKVVTTPDEAVTFIKALNENGIEPDVLAIANGTIHGNVYDDKGNQVEQVGIDLEQTMNVARALREMGSHVRIAQHGITGTPRELINTMFPKGDIIKGNVATFWQNIVLDIVKVYDPDFYKEMWDWTIKTYGPKNPGKSEGLVFGKNVKNAIGNFYMRFQNLEFEAVDTIEALTYAEARTFFKAFGATGTACIVRDAME